MQWVASRYFLTYDKANVHKRVYASVNNRRIGKKISFFSTVNGN